MVISHWGCCSRELHYSREEGRVSGGLSKDEEAVLQVRHELAVGPVLTHKVVAPDYQVGSRGSDALHVQTSIDLMI